MHHLHTLTQLATPNTTEHHQLTNSNQQNDKNNIEELKTLVHSTQPDIITIQETKLTYKSKPLKYLNTPPCAQTGNTNEEGIINHHTDDITFTNINIPEAINTHNTELQLIKIHIGKTKHITVANTYFSPSDTTSPHYNILDTDITQYIQHVTYIPDSILTGDLNAHTDDHRVQLISDIISNSEHSILSTNTPTRMPHTTLQKTTSPHITTISTTLYYRTTWHTTHALRSPSHNHNNQYTHQVQTTIKQTHIHQL